MRLLGRAALGLLVGALSGLCAANANDAGAPSSEKAKVTADKEFISAADLVSGAYYQKLIDKAVSMTQRVSVQYASLRADTQVTHSNNDVVGLEVRLTGRIVVTSGRDTLPVPGCGVVRARFGPLEELWKGAEKPLAAGVVEIQECRIQESKPDAKLPGRRSYDLDIRGLLTLSTREDPRLIPLSPSELEKGVKITYTVTVEPEGDGWVGQRSWQVENPDMDILAYAQGRAAIGSGGDFITLVEEAARRDQIRARNEPPAFRAVDPEWICSLDEYRSACVGALLEARKAIEFLQVAGSSSDPEDRRQCAVLRKALDICCPKVYALAAVEVSFDIIGAFEGPRR